MSSEDKPLVVDELGAKVDSSETDGPEEPAAKKQKKRAPSDNSKRGSKVNMEKHIAQYPGLFSLFKYMTSHSQGEMNP